MAGLATKAQTAKRPSVLSLGGSFSTHGKKKYFGLFEPGFLKTNQNLAGIGEFLLGSVAKGPL